MAIVEPLAHETAETEQHFAHNLEASGPLAARAAQGVAWVAGARLGSQVVQFLASLVLARLIDPSAYGLVAIVWTFTGFAFLFSDLGLGSSLVQSPRITEGETSTAFYINAVAGLVLTGIVVLLRVPLANLFGQPRLAGLLALASVGFTIAISTVPTALLERQMKFGLVAAIDIGSSTLGFLISIACAVAGLGAYSLVIGPLAATGMTSIASLVAARWLPRARFSRASARRLFSFGGHLTGFNLINYWSRNADNLLLGRFAGPTELGFYNRAYMLMLMPINQVNGVLGRVLLPVFSSLQDDRERLRRGVLRVCRTSGVLVFPILFGLAGCAHNFVLVAFGPRWSGVVTLLTILAISGAPQVVAATSGLVCQAVGQTKLLSTWGNLSSISVVAAILIGLPWGAEGVAIAYAVRAYLLLPLAFVPMRRAADIGTAPMLRAAALPFYAAVLMAGCVWSLGTILDHVIPMGVCLVLQVLVGAVVYAGVLVLVDPSTLTDVKSVVRRRQVA